MSNNAERFLEGMDAYQRGSYDAAVIAFQEVLKEHPDAPDALVNLGNVLYKQGNLNEARKQWTRATEVDPLSPTPYLNLGNMYYATEKHSEAVLQWEIALELMSEIPSSLYLNLGMAYEALYNPTRAHEYYSRYMSCRNIGQNGHSLKQRLIMSYKVAKHNLMLAETAMRRGQLEKARAGFSRSVPLVPFPVKYCQHYATVLYKLKQYKEALFWYEAATNAEVYELSVLTNLGVLYEKFNEPIQALWAYQRAIKLYPSNVSKTVQDRYTILWHSQGKVKIDEAHQRVEADILQGRLQRANHFAHRLFDVVFRETPDEIDRIQALLNKLDEYYHPKLRVGRDYYDNAVTFDSAGHHAEALSAYEAFVNLMPEDDKADAARTRCAELRSLINTALPA